MADMMFENRGVFGRSTPAWHGKGKVVAGLLSVEEALKQAGLDYEVRKVPAYWVEKVQGVGDNGPIVTDVARPVPGTYITVGIFPDREPIPFGPVGEIYTVVPNTAAIGFFSAVTEKGEAVTDAAGALWNGRKIWLAAMIPDLTYSAGSEKDKVHTYLVFMNSHDGSSGVVCIVTEVRVVCWNTWRAGISAAQTMVKIKHTTNAQDRIMEATRLMGLVRKGFEARREASQKLATIKLTPQKRAEYIANALGIDLGEKLKPAQEERLMQVAHLLNTDPLADKDTAWGAFNAITAWVDHIKPVKQTEKAKAANGGAKLDSIWFGGDAEIKTRALDMALALA